MTTESQTTIDQALNHLGEVLQLLADLHPDDRCQVLDDALAFYNERHPDARVEPVPGFISRLVIEGPVDRWLKEHPEASEATPDSAISNEPQATDEVIAETITSLAKHFDDELYALSESQLAEQWYFRWDAHKSVVWNLYVFSDMLEMHKRRCRRWEEHHNGSVCVVERVRDKYLMPRIKAFLTELSNG